ncbi:hypothetical protein N42HA_00917 [Lactococcus lactis]|nr:hypothetical protein [Lactococcus lactis]
MEQNGTAAQTWLQENQKKYGYTIKTYSDGVHMFAALSSGNIAGAMDEVPVISYAMKQGQDLAMNFPSSPFQRAIGFCRPPPPINEKQKFNACRWFQ